MNGGSITGVRCVQRQRRAAVPAQDIAMGKRKRIPPDATPWRWTNAAVNQEFLGKGQVGEAQLLIVAWASWPMSDGRLSLENNHAHDHYLSRQVPAQREDFEIRRKN